MIRFGLKIISGFSLLLFSFQKVFKLFRLITEIATEIANIQVSSFYFISLSIDYLLYAYHIIFIYIISLYNEYIIFNYHINRQHFIQYHIKPLRNSTMFYSKL